MTTSSLPGRAQRPLRRLTSWLLFAVGVAALGYVGFSLLEAEIFQAYENRRLDRAVQESQRHVKLAASPAVLLPPSELVETRATPAAQGAALGRIEIKRIGVSAIIVEGTNSRSLRRAVGHISGTALPGDAGNVAIAGHRDTFFRNLRHIRQGDEITLTTHGGEYRYRDEITLTTHGGEYRYRVQSMQVVAPEQIDVLGDTGEPVLTLVTCYPFYFAGPAPQRFVVRAHRE